MKTDKLLSFCAPLFERLAYLPFYLFSFSFATLPKIKSKLSKLLCLLLSPMRLTPASPNYRPLPTFSYSGQCFLKSYHSTQEPFGPFGLFSHWIPPPPFQKKFFFLYGISLCLAYLLEEFFLIGIICDFKISIISFF